MPSSLMSDRAPAGYWQASTLPRGACFSFMIRSRTVRGSATSCFYAISERAYRHASQGCYPANDALRFTRTAHHTILSNEVAKLCRGRDPGSGFKYNTQLAIFEERTMASLPPVALPGSGQDRGTRGIYYESVPFTMSACCVIDRAKILYVYRVKHPIP